MRKSIPAANPDAYVAALSGWRALVVKTLRAGVLRAKPEGELIKWGHIVYFANGPVALIRAEDARVLFGFWRGKRLTALEPRLKPGGKYELGTWEIREGDAVNSAKAAALMRAAIALNRAVGDPTQEKTADRGNGPVINRKAKRTKKTRSV